MRLGTTLTLVTLVHVLVIALLLSHFGWLGGNVDTDTHSGQSGIVIPVTLEKSEEPESTSTSTSESDPDPDPKVEPEPEPKPEPKSETKSEPKPEPESEPTPEANAEPQSDSEKEPSSDEITETGKEIPLESDPPATTPPVQPALPPTSRPAAPPMPAQSTVSQSSAAPSASGSDPAKSSVEALPITPAQIDPNYLHRPDPVYPAMSKRLREEGTVVLRVSLDEHGTVQDIAIQTSSDFQRLDQAAREAVRQWRFVPAKRGQLAVPSTVLVPIAFRHQ